MAQWETKSVKEIVQDIDDGIYLLPVIQRWLVWDEDKMSLLFDSLLKGNSFGGIMVLEEERGNKPLFASRRFSRFGEEHDSTPVEKVERKSFLVIDGQQRLQSFYMGLKGSYFGQQLYFNLFSSNQDYEFEFVKAAADLNGENDVREDNLSRQKLWYSANTLFEKLRVNANVLQIAKDISTTRHIEDAQLKECIQENVLQFYMWIFNYPTIGLSTVKINREPDAIEEEKQRFVELFRRLNDGGTRLSALDLMASVFKGFDYRMEQFFKKTQEFADMRLYQDEIIKLIFILQDQPTKEVTQIIPDDAHFVLQNQDRIIGTLKAVRNFLTYAGLLAYYEVRGRSVIPLYFIAYHIYYTPHPTEKLASLFDNHDIHNPDFLRIKRWLYLSVLNSVFSRGVGWIPYRTGISKILRTLQPYQGRAFPAQALFRTYSTHPLRFSEELTTKKLPDWDTDFVFYLMYQRQPEVGRDVDHVHPKSRLDDKFPPEKIHSIANYQLLDIGTNRNTKRAKPLADWIESGVGDKQAYLRRHLIPEDKALWDSRSFLEFHQKRAEMIVAEVDKFIPKPLPDPEPIFSPSTYTEIVEAGLNLAALKEKIPSGYENHPILKDQTSWQKIFKPLKLGNRWSGSYRNELARFNIHTVSDLALTIMTLKLEVWYDAGYALVYRFHYPDPAGQKIQFNHSRFAGWGWSVTLDALQKRGFEWQTFVVP